MTIHNQSILDKAEKYLKRKTVNCLGTEIESVKTELIPECLRGEYKKLYAEAKKNYPEIWGSSVYNLNDDIFIQNKEFFEDLFIITENQFVCECFPMENDLKKIKAESIESIHIMYDYLQWFLSIHDYTPKLKTLLKYTHNLLLLQNNKKNRGKNENCRC